jgi:hypothetical protein
VPALIIQREFLEMTPKSIAHHIVFFTGLLLLVGTQSLFADEHADETNASSSLTVYKTPTCGCCGKWVDYMEKAGFNVSVQELRDLSAIKRDAGVPVTHQSCHTAIADVDGYVFEGHIPAKFVRAFLANPPEDARGLVVPAMPLGSPGMEYQDQFAAYDVFLLKADGTFDVYASVKSPADARD